MASEPEPPQGIGAASRPDPLTAALTPADLDAAVGPYIVATDHVGVAVADIEAAKMWWRNNLGFECVHEEVNEEQGVREAMLAVGDSGTYLQLLAPLSADTTIGRFLSGRGPGIQQVAYRVTDIDEACARLRAAGVQLAYDAPKRGTAGSRVNFIHPRSSGGVLVELVQPPA